VQLIRAVVAEAAPGVLIVTETNVPHRENASYFGDGHNEAHLVYNFTLPPLMADAVVSGRAPRLTQWCRQLRAPSAESTYLNFTASHDGVGLMPAAGILTEEEIDRLILQTHTSGGAVSLRARPDGSTTPYELNVSYFDLLNADQRQESQDLRVRRFLVTQAIMLALAGVPAVYLHSLLGSRNFIAGVEASGQARAINRERLELGALEQELSEVDSLRSTVFRAYRNLIRARALQPAFHPNAAQVILELDDRVFALERRQQGEGARLLALHNVSDEAVALTVPVPDESVTWTDVISGRTLEPEHGGLSLGLPPYRFAWLTGW
jgi:sucrose phosphorylase